MDRVLDERHTRREVTSIFAEENRPVPQDRLLENLTCQPILQRACRQR